ncbi:MAG: prolipoprotein diacylglyceryl transferase family protein [Ruminococcus sp.]|nr:prolipoprotein diacylglyceryl transferase family protein [Ruminococcus sp.]
MLPVIHLFSLELSTYGLCSALGLVIMAFTAFLLGRKHNILIEDIIFGELTALVGAFIGAHILYAVTNAAQIYEQLTIFFERNKDISYLWEIIRVYAGGMVFYGGLIGGLVFGIIYCKIRKISLGLFSDCFAVAIPLFHACGRVGCFLSGCCYGVESGFGFTATQSIIDSCNGVCRFPVQLLESFLNLVIFAILLILFRKGIMIGRLIYIYLIMYGTVRFFDEFLRGDEYRGILLNLSTSQWISLILIIFAIIILIKNKSKAVE